MDNLGQAMKLRDGVLERFKRPGGFRSEGFHVDLAFRLAMIIALALVDIAGSLREMSGIVYAQEGDEEVTDDGRGEWPNGD